MKLIRNISRLVIAAVFIFSGFVKALDPLGSTYKFTDYFVAFQMDWLSPAALFFSVVLSAVEFAIGFALLNNVLTRLSSIAMFVFMSFFTALTFYLALSNPVSDCGCFGDAIKLTNWETFYKNLAFMVPATIVFVQRKKYNPRFGRGIQISILAIGLLISLFISKNAYNHLPQIDFRPYKMGTNINLAMNNNLEGAPQPEFETIIVYEKDGEQKEFTTDNLPDSTWTWVETISEQKEMGYEAPIHNFNLTTADKQDVTDIVLSDERFTLMFVAYDLDKIKKDAVEKLRTIMDIATAKNYQVFIVTASNPEDVNQFERKNSMMGTFYFADPITLKTIVRSNPGLVFMHKGQVLKKWHHNDFPTEDQLTEYDLYNASLKQQNNITWQLIGTFMFLWFLISAFFEIVGLKSRML